MFAGLVREEIAAALDAAVAALLAEAGVAEPPVDAFAVARALDITVAFDQRQEGRARYVRLGGGRTLRPRATILLRPDPRGERRQWAVAHELGEHSAHRVCARLGIEPCEVSPNGREAIANQLAGRLLLPSEWFEANGSEVGWDLLALKHRYATASHELIARRMLDCRPAIIISIFDQGELSYRRSNLPGHVPPPSAAERQCWGAVHRSNRSHEACDGPRAIHGWPIHEDDWKREIVRTEVEEFLED